MLDVKEGCDAATGIISKCTPHSHSLTQLLHTSFTFGQSKSSKVWPLVIQLRTPLEVPNLNVFHWSLLGVSMSFRTLWHSQNDKHSCVSGRLLVIEWFTSSIIIALHVIIPIVCSQPMRTSRFCDWMDLPDNRITMQSSTFRLSVLSLSQPMKLSSIPVFRLSASDLLDNNQITSHFSFSMRRLRYFADDL